MDKVYHSGGQEGFDDCVLDQSSSLTSAQHIQQVFNKGGYQQCQDF
jgi:hypothetical protein